MRITERYPGFNQLLKSYGINQEVLATLHILIQFGNGIPMHLIEEHRKEVQKAVDLGFILLVNDKIFATRKANKFILEVLTLARSVGELQ